MSQQERTTVFVEGIELEGSIGVHPHEHAGAQTIRLDVELGIVPPERADIVATFDYADILDAAATELGCGHVALAEQLARRLGERLLTHDHVLDVIVRVTKPHALGPGKAAGDTWRSGGPAG